MLLYFKCAVTCFPLKEDKKILAKLKIIQTISRLVNHVCLCDCAHCSKKDSNYNDSNKLRLVEQFWRGGVVNRE
jgi:hypothetical protein